MQTVVDVSRLRHNIRIIRNRTRNGFCAVVKSDAYGHGIAVGGVISPLVDCFMVANAKEAMELLPLTDKPILVLGGDISPFAVFAEPQIIPTVCNVKQLDAVLRFGYKHFSVAVNTGMNRLGADRNELDEIVSYCKQNDIVPWSVYSHIYGGISSASEQAAEFENATKDKVLNVRRHLYSSCALDLQGYNLFDMIRSGIAMYGFSAYTEPCIKVRAKIVDIKSVPRGEHIGYGDYTLDRDALIATVAIGYADGLRRCDKQLYLTVRGKKCKIIGMPCMDLCMIDISGLEPRVGEYAYLVNGKADVEYLAKCYGTIVYEVLTGFNGRTERVFL